MDENCDNCEVCIKICKNKKGFAPSISTKRYLWTHSEIANMIGLLELLKLSLLEQGWDLIDEELKKKNEQRRAGSDSVSDPVPS